VVADERGDGAVRILVVCTANQCRSPLTAAALARRAADAGLPVEVRSAGIKAVAGLPATPPTVEAGRRIGLDLSGHVSTPLHGTVVHGSDLVIGLERRHVQEIVLEDPRAFPRAYTLKEFVRRGEQVGPRAPGQDLGEWLALVHRGRKPIDLLGVSSDDDVADPTGSRAADHRTTAEEIDALSAEALALLFGPQ
jgi:protein-tyrosine phosphatase